MKWPVGVAVFIFIWLAPLSSLHAAQGSGKASHKSDEPDGELSIMGSYSKTDYGNNTYSTSHHYTATLGVNITSVTEIELSYAYTDSFFNQDPVQTSSVNEQSLGLSLVQALTSTHSIIQPYVKGGAAQYNRKQSGSVSGIPTTPVSTKSPSGILGGGLRVFITRHFSLKVEAAAYLPNFNISGARNNNSIEGGIGWTF